MFDKLKKIWNDKGYEILIGSCLVIILVLALFKIGKKGTWSSSYNFDQYTNDKNTHSK